jgi:CheY-like chemotaxis protein
MEGKIAVRSVKGQGSVFEASVVLNREPRRGEVEVFPNDIRAEAPANDESPTSNMKLSILLAEDDPFSQQFAYHILTQTGHSVDIAKNGLEAIQCVKSMNYDVVLMDIQMPGKDGLEVTRYIREEMTTGKQPYIIAVTARAMQGERERFLQAGMDNYLSKPFSKTDLLEIIIH